MCQIFLRSRRAVPGVSYPWGFALAFKWYLAVCFSGYFRNSRGKASEIVNTGHSPARASVSQKISYLNDVLLPHWCAAPSL